MSRVISQESKEKKKLYNKLRYEKNKELLKEKRKIRYKNNKEKELLYQKEFRKNNKNYFQEYRETNKDYLKEYQKEYQEKNKNKIKDYLKDYLKEYRKNNKDYLKEYQKEYQEKNKDLRNKNHKERKENDILFRLKCNIKSMVSKSIKNNGFQKESRTYEILGCSYELFKEYIEKQFESWMNWENYGNPKDDIYEPNKTWDIDHIKPLASATTEGELIKLNHYTNLQPLCSYHNRFIKKDNY